jgi:hypothetical protein
MDVFLQFHPIKKQVRVQVFLPFLTRTSASQSVASVARHNVHSQLHTSCFERCFDRYAGDGECNW